MNIEELSDTVEKDLSVYITTDLNSSKQCSEAVKKANEVLGMINRHFVLRDMKTIIWLYKCLVRLIYSTVCKYGILIAKRISIW